MLYPVLRASLERYRGDTLRGVEHFGLLSTSQVVSIPLALLGVGLLATRAKHGLAPEKPWEPEEEEDAGEYDENEDGGYEGEDYEEDYDTGESYTGWGNC